MEERVSHGEINRTCRKKDVEEWIRWSLTLTHPDPFDPSDGGANWDKNQQNESVIFLAALAATEPPPDQPSERDDSTAGDGDVVYHQDNGTATDRRPTVEKRIININSNDKRNILIPVLTEAACKVKYKKANDLKKLAKKIIGKEKDGEIPSASIEFDNSNGNLPPEKYNGNDLKKLDHEGSIQELLIPRGNVFHQWVKTPPSSEKVGYHGYWAMLKRDALRSSNSLKFTGGKGYYKYEVEYTINLG
jgi:hypothetical protein